MTTGDREAYFASGSRWRWACMLFTSSSFMGLVCAVRWIGLALSLIGLTGVMLVRYTLGRSFSIRAKATELVTTGIYSRIRNPIYVSGVIFLVGMIVMVGRAASWLVLGIIIIIPMQIIRARREARVLEARFGDAYRQYRSRTWF